MGSSYSLRKDNIKKGVIKFDDIPDMCGILSIGQVAITGVSYIHPFSLSLSLTYIHSLSLSNERLDDLSLLLS